MPGRSRSASSSPGRGAADRPPRDGATRVAPAVGEPGRARGDRRPVGSAPVRGRRPPRRRAGWGRRIAAVVAVLLLLVVGFGVYLDTRMTRVDALGSYAGRPSGGSGTNWLVVGSDSRAGLTPADEQQLGTGDAQGNRTDTMMLVHVGGIGGQTSLVSLPRDSYLAIPGHGRNRLNAAYSLGGPALLVQTVEQASGLRIDHYAEIGFEGFATMVDAVGGVNMCLDAPIDDPKAGIDLPAGCQDLNGPNALGYVRTRAFPNADLQRVQNQRKFLAALVAKAASPTTLLNPFRIVPFANAAVGTLTVDSSTHVWNLGSLGLAMRSLSGGSGVTTTVPVTLSTSVSGAVVWDSKKAPQLWSALRSDDPIPSDALTPAN